MISSNMCVPSAESKIIPIFFSFSHFDHDCSGLFRQCRYTKTNGKFSYKCSTYNQPKIWYSLPFGFYLVTHFVLLPIIQVPRELKPTWSGRTWLVNPLCGDELDPNRICNPFYTIFVAIVPALLATILLFMDQQITAVIVNRKEHKLIVSLLCT